jgi:hypothetical protein
MLLSASLLISVDIVSALSLTPLSSTLWLRTVTPALWSLCAAISVTHEISLGWLKCVWRAMDLPAALAFWETSMRASAHPSEPSTRRPGATARPLEAKRNRRMCGMPMRRSPIILMCSGSR